MRLHTTISLYWKCQVVGWCIASFYWGYAAFVQASNFNFQQGFADFTLDVLIGILLTHSYRNFALRKKWHTLKLKILVPRIALAIFMLSLAYMVLIIFKLYLNRLLFNQNLITSFWEFFRSGWLITFITGTRLMSIWVLAYHLYQYAQREINIAKENARLSIIAKEAQLNNLSSQLNPHFFFNSLGNIKFLVMENPASARRAIDLLSDLLRNSLYGKDDKWISVKKEIGFVTDYLELEKLRFEDRLQVNIITSEELAEISIPPFCIQALVENAIKHGIEKRNEGGFIQVKAERKDGLIKISIENSGRLDKKKKPGLGLKNLEERLSLQYSGKARFKLEELPGEKIMATILISIV